MVGGPSLVLPRYDANPPGRVTFTCTALCFSHETWQQGEEREQ